MSVEPRMEVTGSMATEAVTLDQVLGITEQLKPSDQLRLISILSERLRQEIEPGAGLIDMLSLAGLGSDLWAQIDVAAHLEQERARTTAGCPGFRGLRCSCFMAMCLSPCQLPAIRIGAKPDEQ